MLKYQGYSEEEAAAAADTCGADWNEQAERSAMNYMQYMALSQEELVEQLIYDGFTEEQAQYGADAVYNDQSGK